VILYLFQAGKLSENSLISEIFVSISEKNRQVFLLNAYDFRDFLIFRLNFQRFFSTPCSPHCYLLAKFFSKHSVVQELWCQSTRSLAGSPVISYLFIGQVFQSILSVILSCLQITRGLNHVSDVRHCDVIVFVIFFCL
jgi:hypothetical protein